ncbi:unnamed protein product, partial [Ectocarpus sp. 8 AP-2014]
LNFFFTRHDNRRRCMSFVLLPRLYSASKQAPRRPQAAADLERGYAYSHSVMQTLVVVYNMRATYMFRQRGGDRLRPQPLRPSAVTLERRRDPVRHPLQ